MSRYAYSLRQDALEVALASLFGAAILTPTLAASGSSVAYTVLTDAQATQVIFYAISDGVETRVRPPALICAPVIQVTVL